ncbi:MAG TPA: 30S ribosomal protein THX [Oleiagrimonas sp.]|nr:30S ribosomal protein THX [Oleiagrimonas sp.]
MGKGDKRTRRGKIYNGSHGKARPHKATHHDPAEKAAVSSPARKTVRRRKPA